MWIDTHCHPLAKPFSEDREAVFERAKAAGVEKMLVVGFSQETNRQALEYAAEYDQLWATLGIHPCDVDELTDDEYAWIAATAKSNPRVVGIGETGLDYHHMSFPKAQQQHAFARQIHLAKELDLPLIVHSRDAAEDTLTTLVQEKAEKVIFHCYSYDYEFGKKVWEQGYVTSFSGVLTYSNAKEIQEAAQKGPLEQFLIETDCPYLAPQSHRGKRNEMAFVTEVAEKLADLRGLGLEELSGRLAQNTYALFPEMKA